jgi:hypothetical protein
MKNGESESISFGRDIQDTVWAQVMGVHVENYGFVS